jgi:hypothetical protein
VGWAGGIATGNTINTTTTNKHEKMILAATPYDDDDSEGTMGVPHSPALSMGSSSSNDSIGRRRSPSAGRKSLPMQRIRRQTQPTEEHDGGSPDDISRTPIHADEGHSTIRGTIFNYVIEKSKAVVLGQLLAFWLVSTTNFLLNHMR